MPNYYPYLIASLPFLQFGTKAPFTFSRFLELCRDFVPPMQFKVLENCADITKEPQTKAQTKGIEKAWRDFEFKLRNELVKARARRLHKEAGIYLRSSIEAELHLVHVIADIMRQPVYEAERMLDNLRWNKLEELAFGHYFDQEFLFVYAQKLLILERWDRIRGADKQKLLNSVLEIVEQRV